jgi:hypothetical protein
MSRAIELRLKKLELGRVPRPPYVVSVNYPMTATDRAAIANARGPVAVLPYKCATVEEWSARSATAGTLQ